MSWLLHGETWTAQVVPRMADGISTWLFDFPQTQDMRDAVAGDVALELRHELRAALGTPNPHLESYNDVAKWAGPRGKQIAMKQLLVYPPIRERFEAFGTESAIAHELLRTYYTGEFTLAEFAVAIDATVAPSEVKGRADRAYAAWDRFLHGYWSDLAPGKPVFPRPVWLPFRLLRPR